MRHIVEFATVVAVAVLVTTGSAFAGQTVRIPEPISLSSSPPGPPASSYCGVSAGSRTVLAGAAEWLAQVHYGIAGAVLLALGLLETFRPARSQPGGTAARWGLNIGLEAAGVLAMTVLAPALLAAWVVRVTDWQWHPVLSLGDRFGNAAALAAGFLLIDLYAYAAHRIEHAVFWLWRFHAVHHADVEMDVTTAVRHHPVEAVLIPITGLVIFTLLGIPPWVATIYGTVAIVVAMAHHANTAWPRPLERALRTVIVTPGLHALHHSTDPRDHDTNYGAVFSFWDRLFGTWRDAPASGQNDLAFGVEGFTAPADARPGRTLLLPFLIRRAPQPTPPRPTPTTV